MPIKFKSLSDILSDPKSIASVVSGSKRIGSFLPVFKEKFSLEEAVKEVTGSNPEVLSLIGKDPEREKMFMQSLERTYKQYKGPVYWGRVIDSFDRVTSGLDLIGQAVTMGGSSLTFSLGEEAIEMIPKVPYAAYYVAKTGDWKAVPYWLAYEVASLIPGIGDFFDLKNIYLNRAHKKFQEAAVRDFKKTLKLQEELQKLKSRSLPRSSDEERRAA